MQHTIHYLRGVPCALMRGCEEGGDFLAVGTTTDEVAVRLLRATREQLRGNPTRAVQPIKVAEKAGIDPYRIEYARAVGYLLDHGYVEPYSAYSPGLYRVTSKGLEAILSSP